MPRVAPGLLPGSCAGSETAFEFAGEGFEHCLQRGVIGVALDQAYEGAAHDDGLDESAEFGDVRGIGDAEANGKREIRGRAHGLNEGGDGSRERVLLAGDARSEE